MVVVGTGITGLLMARSLARLGYEVLLLENTPFASSGATSRNEGWLHRGTYHAASISNYQEAVAVARRCIYGARRISDLVPEAVEDPFRTAFAVTTRPDIDEVEARWRDAGVVFRRLSWNQMRHYLAGVRIDDVSAGYEVADGSVNTSILSRVLLQENRQAGVKVMLNAHLGGLDDGQVHIYGAVVSS